MVDQIGYMFDDRQHETIVRLSSLHSKNYKMSQVLVKTGYMCDTGQHGTIVCLFMLYLLTN